MLRVERRGTTLLWTIARPEAKNALNAATLAELGRAVADARKDPTVRAAVLTGEGDTFVSGGDLRELRDRAGPEDAARFADAGLAVCRGMQELDVPVFAAIAGVAFGGGLELALACDARVADPAARLSFKHARMGVTPAWGTLGRLRGVVGLGRASRLLFTAQEIGATEALALGLVDGLSEPGRALPVALAWCDDVARGSPAAVAALKRLQRTASEAAPPSADERSSFVALWSGPDREEAMRAFFEQRAPAWKPRG